MAEICLEVIHKEGRRWFSYGGIFFNLLPAAAILLASAFHRASAVNVLRDGTVVQRIPIIEVGNEFKHLSFVRRGDRRRNIAAGEFVLGDRLELEIENCPSDWPLREAIVTFYIEEVAVMATPDLLMGEAYRERLENEKKAVQKNIEEERLLSFVFNADAG